MRVGDLLVTSIHGLAIATMTRELQGEYTINKNEPHRNHFNHEIWFCF